MRPVLIPNSPKTSLDDWIKTCKDYNTYRGSFWANIIGGFLGSRFPAKIDYYEGQIKALDMDTLNPQNKK